MGFSIGLFSGRNAFPSKRNDVSCRFSSSGRLLSAYSQSSSMYRCLLSSSKPALFQLILHSALNVRIVFRLRCHLGLFEGSQLRLQLANCRLNVHQVFDDSSSDKLGYPLIRCTPITTSVDVLSADPRNSLRSLLGHRSGFAGNSGRELPTPPHSVIAGSAQRFCKCWRVRVTHRNFWLFHCSRRLDLCRMHIY